MQLSAALLPLAILGAVASAQEVCSNADGTTSTTVAQFLSCTCPGPTTTVFAYTATATSAKDCHGCSKIVASTIFARCKLGCFGPNASPTATSTTYATDTATTEFICSPTP